MIMMIQKNTTGMRECSFRKIMNGRVGENVFSEMEQKMRTRKGAKCNAERNVNFTLHPVSSSV